MKNIQKMYLFVVGMSVQTILVAMHNAPQEQQQVTKQEQQQVAKQEQQQVAKQEQQQVAKQDEQDLVFYSDNKEIARLPLMIARIISPVFIAQVDSTMQKDVYSIHVKDVQPETVILFVNLARLYFLQVVQTALGVGTDSEKIVNEYNISSSPENMQSSVSDLIKNILEDHKHLLLDLYAFFDKYEAKKMVSLIAQPLIEVMAQDSDICNTSQFPFESDDMLKLLAQGICESTANIGINIHDHRLIAKNVSAMVMSQDNKTLVVQEIGGRIAYYSLDNHLLKKTINTGIYDYKKYSSDFRYLANQSKTSPKSLQVIDLNAQDILCTISNPGDAIVQAMGTNGMLILVDKQRLILHNCITNQKVGEINCASNIRHVKFGPNQDYITVLDNKTINKYNINSLIGVPIAPGHAPYFHSQFSADGSLLAIAFYDNTLDVYDTVHNKRIATFAFKNLSDNIAFSQDGKILAVLDKNTDDDENGIIKVYNLITGQEIKKIALSNSISSLRFSPGGNYLVTAGSSAKITIFPLYSNTGEIVLESQKVPVFAFCPQDRLLVYGMASGEMALYNMLEKKILAKMFNKGNNNFFDMQFSVDGRSILVGAARSIYSIPITICDLPDRQIVAVATAVARARLLQSGDCECNPLQQSGWLYKQLNTLSSQQREKLFKQFNVLQGEFQGAKKGNDK